MKKIFNYINKFMNNRYQDDELYYFMFKIYIIILFINLFIKDNILNIINVILAIIILFRYLSKDIKKRKQENILFLKYRNIFINKINNIKKFVLDKNHIYRKCDKCKTIIKLPLPNNRGIKKVKCPECGKMHKYLIFRKQKIEIIRKK